MLLEVHIAQVPPCMIENEEETTYPTNQATRKNISTCSQDVPERDTYIVESAQAAGVFAAAAERTKVEAPLFMLLNSRSANKRGDLIVFRSRFLESLLWFWKGVVCGKRNLAVRSSAGLWKIRRLANVTSDQAVFSLGFTHDFSNSQSRTREFSMGR
jgi:hypothetical protein